MRIFNFKNKKIKNDDIITEEKQLKDNELINMFNERKTIEIENSKITPFSEKATESIIINNNKRNDSEEEIANSDCEILNKLYLRRKAIFEFKILNYIPENYGDIRNVKYQTKYYSATEDEKLNEFAIEYIGNYKNADIKSKTKFLEKLYNNDKNYGEYNYKFINIEMIENYINEINDKSDEELSIVNKLDSSILSEEIADTPKIQLIGKFSQFNVIDNNQKKDLYNNVEKKELF